MKQGCKAAAAKRKDDNKDDDKPNQNGGGNWKKKMKKAIQIPQSLKSVMALLAQEESNNQAFISALADLAALAASTEASAAVNSAPALTAPPPAPAQKQPSIGSVDAAFPATQVMLQRILKNEKKS